MCGPQGLDHRAAEGAGSSLAANIAADLSAWTRLFGLDGHPDLAAAEPGTLRLRLRHLLAGLMAHARRRTLKILPDWLWGSRRGRSSPVP